jgi:signal transduction histidine kinase/DNA-binding response OmpR family regulator
VNPVTFIIELLFAAVFVGALISFIRGRDPLAGDVTLVFSALAAIFVLQVGRAALGAASIPTVLNAAAIVLLLAQPFFTLRLVGKIRELPRWALPFAALALSIPAGVLAAVALTDRSSPLIGPLLAAVVVAFVGTELAAASYLAGEARRRAGSTRIRLAVAALGTAALAIAILAAAAGSAVGATSQGGSSPATLAIALVAAIAYVVAFLPPAWLRRIWQATAAYDYSQRTLDAPPSEDEESLWRRLATATVEVSGSSAALVIVGDPDGSARVAAVAGPRADSVALTTPATIDEIAALAVDHQLRRIEPGKDPVLDELAAETGSRYATIIRLPTSDDSPAVLVHLARQASLFGADDAELLSALGGIAAIVVERRAVLTEQELLTQRLRATVTALESAGQAKSDFLASMSHELRTPLNAVIGFSDLMRGEPRDGDTLRVPAEWVEHIYGSGQHLLGLINDVLDLTKVEAGRVDLVLEQLDVSAAVLESVAGLRPLADRKSIAIEMNLEPAVVDADRGRFRQIVYNLLSNAIKYTPEGGTITVETRPEGRTAAISVADTGIGISEVDQAVVFEEFRQVGDPVARQPGTGLGLALTKRLVEAHGGRIELSSAPGVGSRFTVTLPAVAPAGEPALGSAAADVVRRATPVSGGDVLVIEDDPSAVRLLRAYLESDGYRVRIASDGEQGLAEARRRAPSAIVLDVILPGLDGWDVLRQIKTDEGLRDVPVIIVTVVDEREVGMALGAADYLVKPVDRSALLDCLGRLTFTTKVQASPVRVLAVDDDPAALDMIEAALRPSGFDVLRATGGKAGLDLARSVSPDLVICDLLMPDLDGFGVVAELAANPWTRHLPILILTAHEITESEKTRLNGNILGIVAKGENGKAGLHDWLIRALPPRPSGVADGA